MPAAIPRASPSGGVARRSRAESARSIGASRYPGALDRRVAPHPGSHPDPPRQPTACGSVVDHNTPVTHRRGAAVSCPGMTPDEIADYFAVFGPVTVRRMFSGYGISSEGVVFAMALRSGMIMRVDEQTVHRYDAEGAPPFQYQTRKRTVVVRAFRVMPERLYDDPEELAMWSREAVGAARRAKRKPARRMRPTKAAKRPAATKPRPGRAKSPRPQRPSARGPRTRNRADR
jgi:DNA transformation protein and related proteins